ncbi:glycosyltransferase [Psychrobacter faecalis]
MKVSIAVITYNSASTVIDTLDSILKQDYGSENIELIISDDASTDDTVEVIHKWLDENSASFFLTNFLENPLNKGISANINQAWKATSCEWIKSIAGDDMLKKNCITKNVEYVSKNIDCKLLFSKMQDFGATNRVTPTDYDIRFFDKSSKEQHNYLKLFSFNIAPSSFIFRDVLEHVGFANERYKMIEDLPLWLKMTELGYKLYFMDEITVDYRVGESVTISNDRYIYLPLTYDLICLYKDQMPIFLKHPFIKMVVLERLGGFYFHLGVAKIFKNKKSKYTNFLNIASIFFRPIIFSQNVLRKIYNIVSSL